MAGNSSLFLQKFIASPFQIGSILPSSQMLAKKMAKAIDWENVSNIAELGAGTGAITKQLVRCLQPKAALHVFERDEQMRILLKNQYHEIFFHANAEQLSSLTGSEQLDAVVSGLPFANFSKTLRSSILNEVVKSLKPGGKFIAFQYTLQMKQMLNETFETVEIQFTPFNFPPAFIYVCTKQNEKS